MIAMLIARGDWLSVVVPIVFFIIYALNQLLTARKPVTPPARKPPRRPPEGERPLRSPQPPAANPQTSGQAQLNAEIEQFLKRANDRRGDRSRQEAAPATRAPKAPPKPPADRPIDVQPLEQGEISSVAASVEKHLSNRTFTQRAEHLADDIVRADQEMEQHLQKAFSGGLHVHNLTGVHHTMEEHLQNAFFRHPVGTLSDVQNVKPGQTPATDQETAVVVAAGSAANAIAGLLADPKNVRQAVILNEVLQRPETRW